LFEPPRHKSLPKSGALAQRSARALRALLDRKARIAYALISPKHEIGNMAGRAARMMRPSMPQQREGLHDEICRSGA